MFKRKIDEVEVMRTRNGYHLILRGVESDISTRMALGDDSDRVSLAERRMRLTNDKYDDILFTSKTYNKKTFVAYRINPLSIPQW
jgi:hypothetical protein